MELSFLIKIFKMPILHHGKLQTMINTKRQNTK